MQQTNGLHWQVFLAQLSRRAELLNDQFQQWVVDTVLAQAVKQPTDPFAAGFDDLQDFDDLPLGDDFAESAKGSNVAEGGEAGTVLSCSQGSNVNESSAPPAPAVAQLIGKSGWMSLSDLKNNTVLRNSENQPQSDEAEVLQLEAASAFTLVGELCHLTSGRGISGGEVQLEGIRPVTRVQDTRPGDNSSSAGTTGAIHMGRIPSYSNTARFVFQGRPSAATQIHKDSEKTYRKSGSGFSSHSKGMADFFGTNSVTSAARPAISVIVDFKEGPGQMQVYPAPIKTLNRMCEKVCLGLHGYVSAWG